MFIFAYVPTYLLPDINQPTYQSIIFGLKLGLINLGLFLCDERSSVLHCLITFVMK